MTAKKSSPRKRAVLLARNYKHGCSQRGAFTAEYRAWKNMIQRCHNPKNSEFHNYGGRGIFVCDEWRHDFAAFFAHIGPKPTPEHQMDRTDNDAGYRAGNVRWVTRNENMRNRRANHLITINGETKSAAAWDEQCGFPGGGKTVLHRYKRGWRGEKLLAPLGSIKPPARKQSLAERRKRSRTMKRNRALGLYDNAGAKTSRTKRRMFAEGSIYNVRDERGCFVPKQS